MNSLLNTNFPLFSSFPSDSDPHSIRLQVKHSPTERPESKKVFWTWTVDKCFHCKDTITSYTFSVYLMPSAFLFSFSQISACRHLICSLFVCCLCFRGSDACDSQRPSSCCFFSESMTTDRHTLVLEPNALTGFPQHFYKLLTVFLRRSPGVCVLHSGLMQPQTLQTSHEGPSRSGQA